MLRCFTAALAALTLLGTAHAQTYPTKPVRVVVPYAPGGATDIVARTISAKLTDALGQQVIVENKPGAATQIATEMVVRSAPDGYTLLMGAMPIAVNPYLYPKLPYDTFKDLDPIILTVTVPAYLLVNSSLPVKDAKDFIEYAKKQQGKLSFSSAGNGTALHLAGELFRLRTGIDAVHVPYKGSAPAVADLAAGQVQYNFENLGPAMPHLKSGKVRALAVAAPKRSTALPDVPTFAELGYPGFEASAWFVLMAPAGTSKEIVQRLNTEVGKILGAADIKERFATLGIEPAGGSPADATAHIKSEAAKWSKIIKDSGAKAD